MAVIDDYTLTTTEDGNLIARDAEGNTISAQDYYGRLVDETYVNETGRASTFNDPGGRQYWLNSLMSNQIQPDQLDDVFNASDEGKAYDARTGNTGGITTVDTGGTTKVDTGGTTKVDTGGITTIGTGGTTTTDAGTTKVTGGGTTNVTTAGGLTLAQVEALVDKTYLDEMGRASTFNDPGGRAYYINEIMSGRILPSKLADYFNASDEGKAFDAKTTKVTGGTTKVTTTGTVSRADADGLVTRLYNDQFGRKPTQGDLDYWAPRVVSGNLNEEGLLREYNASDEGKMFDRIGDLYPLETGRAADFGGQAYYAGLVRDGKMTYDQIAKDISKSKEGRDFDISNLSKGLLTTGYVDPLLTAKLTRLKDLYKTKLGRDPDEGGLRSYLAQEDENYDFNQAIAKSPEALVRDAFKRVLGRAPDAEAVTYYMDELKKGRTYDQIVSDLRKSDEYQTKVSPARGIDGVLYSNPATAARAATNFSGFPLTTKAVTGADGKVTNKLELNLPDQKAFSLGTKEGTFDTFKDYTPTVFAENPYVSNIFGGASKADADRTGVGAQKVFSNAASATQDYSKLGIGTAGGITSLADVTKAANAAPFTLGNTMANNLGTNLGTTAGANLDLTSNAGTIGMAQGGMIMSDPVMRRAMFRNGGPVSSKGYGITSNVTTPDENAMAMQTMFQPPGFRDGGPVQYFEDGGEATVPVEAAPPTPLEALRAQVRTSEPRFKSVMERVREERMLPIDLEQEYTGRSMRGENPVQERPGFRPKMESMTPERRAAERRLAIDDADERAATAGPAGGIGGFFGSVFDRTKEILSGKPKAATAPSAEGADLRQAKAQMRQAIDDRDANDREGLTRVSEDRRTQTPPPDAERKAPEKGRLTIEIEKLKADREANKAQRKENQLLALMQAGFAMAAGRSPNALANIAAGGASGVATLADLEKGRRAEDAALRREILESELAQERTRETAAERQAAREERALSREQLGLKGLADRNARREGQIENIRLRLEALIKDPLVAETDKARYRSQLEASDRELQTLALEESRLNRAILPPGMRQGSGGFPVREVGSSPTPQR